MCRDLLIRFFPRFRRQAGRPTAPGSTLLAAALVCSGLAASAWGKNPLVPAKKPDSPSAAAPNAAQPPAQEERKQQVLANVNGEDIKRDELAKECIKRFGSEVLDSVVHRELIAEHCRKHGVTVSDKEVEDEIERVAAKFKLPKDQWIKLLDKERGIKRKQYARDIIWPTLALRKLVASQLTVTQEEMDKAFASQFGEGVKVRLIVKSDQQEARKLHAQAVANPAEFAALARQHSEDSASASAGGLMQPIRRYLGDPTLENAAFALKTNEISPVLTIRNQYVFMKCEGHIEPVKVDRSQADPLIEDALKEGKLHRAAGDKFLELEKEAKVQKFFGNPKTENANPGVVAMIDDHRITRLQLAEEAIDRHGQVVLEKIIDQRLLAQALRKRNLVVTEADVDAEIARAAVAMGQKTPDGKPDVQAWLKLVMDQEKISEEVYRSDAVWPSVALKKLVGENVKITEEDVKKGYEANFGPRVRVRAIVLSNQRKAQEVWEKARDKSTVENFAQLAKQYSMDQNSGSLGGEVPPIQKHGGQPVLEREAFQLKPGELSGVIQVGEAFVVLFCEGYTKPVQVDMNEARKHIMEDLHEKKQRLAMADEFTRIKDNSEIDNYLAGTLHHPKGMEGKVRGPADPLGEDAPTATSQQPQAGRRR